MMKPRAAVLIVVVIVSIVGLSRAPGWAETPVGTNVDTRIAVGLRAPLAEVQRWLPAPWQVNPTTDGPTKDVNLTLTFVDRLQSWDVEGKAGGSGRVVALGVPARNPQTGESAPFVVRIFDGNPKANLPGTYKNSVAATVRREQTLAGTGIEPGSGSEIWEVRDATGGVIELRVQYQRAAPARVKIEARPHSAVDPSFFRIYRIDQGIDYVKSVPSGIDRTQNAQLRVGVTELRKLFDGTEQILSIAVIPWYVRQVSLP